MSDQLAPLLAGCGDTQAGMRCADPNRASPAPERPARCRGEHGSRPRRRARGGGVRGYDVGGNPIAGFLPGNQTGAHRVSYYSLITRPAPE